MGLLIKRRDRGEAVAALENVPVLHEDLVLIWNGFFELSRSRSYGYGMPNPVTLADMEAWLNLNEVYDVSERKEAVRLFQAMDSKWLSTEADKRKEESVKKRRKK